MNARHPGSTVGQVSDLTRRGILNDQVGDLTYGEGGTGICGTGVSPVFAGITTPGETPLPPSGDSLCTRSGERVELRNPG
jgi:hypothetical protein